MTLTRQTYGQHSSMPAGRTRRALAFCFPIRIWCMFPTSKCRGELDLGLYTLPVLANRGVTTTWWIRKWMIPHPSRQGYFKQRCSHRMARQDEESSLHMARAMLERRYCAPCNFPSNHVPVARIWVSSASENSYECPREIHDDGSMLRRIFSRIALLLKHQLQWELSSVTSMWTFRIPVVVDRILWASHWNRVLSVPTVKATLRLMTFSCWWHSV